MKIVQEAQFESDQVEKTSLRQCYGDNGIVLVVLVMREIMHFILFLFIYWSMEWILIQISAILEGKMLIRVYTTEKETSFLH